MPGVKRGRVFELLQTLLDLAWPKAGVSKFSYVGADGCGMRKTFCIDKACYLALLTHTVTSVPN